MTSTKWKLLPPKLVPIKDIRPSQAYVSISVLVDIYKHRWVSLDLPHVVKQEGTYWLEDGHHQYVAALLSGADSLECRILDNDA